MILALVSLCIPVVVREELRGLGPLNNLQSWTESNPPNICGKGLLVQYTLCEHDPKCSIYAVSDFADIETLVERVMCIWRF